MIKKDHYDDESSANGFECHAPTTFTSHRPFWLLSGYWHAFLAPLSHSRSFTCSVWVFFCQTRLTRHPSCLITATLFWSPALLAFGSTKWKRSSWGPFANSRSLLSTRFGFAWRRHWSMSFTFLFIKSSLPILIFCRGWDGLGTEMLRPASRTTSSGLLADRNPVTGSVLFAV